MICAVINNRFIGGAIMKHNERFLVSARKNPCGFSRVTPVLMNRRRHDAVSAAPGDGNSGHLKREPYPFQMSDAIARVRGRVFYKSHTSRLLGFYNALTNHRCVRDLKGLFKRHVRVSHVPCKSFVSFL